ncbi:glyoxalase [Elstera litoralis]|uniref:Glyoxalase n=1 Tax=Elstera litoralis TaxID=552518 RepID=A0A0F3IQ57_9PROT|nr:VOC family protein [Elstera litoralis]KJV08747.1 glyoxalase [Elstera litoralis]
MSPQPRTRLISALRYANPERALEFLVAGFGFAEHTVYRGDAGAIVHAELRFGDDILMFGPDIETPFANFMILPEKAGGRNTQTIYVIVDDVDAHHAQAVAAGAEIVMPLVDTGYGGRGYSARDPGGHVWSFGTYDPWTAAGPKV